MNIKIGEKFPVFSLKNQAGETIQNSDFLGKWLVVYFYPKDDTRGCTIQGKEFTLSKDLFDELDISIVGVSQDDTSSHKSFHDKFSFTIDLLADTERVLISKVGLPELEWEGVKYWGRTTVLVNKKGLIEKIYENVTPEGHEKEILSDIKMFMLE